ncbi:ectomycorrhiza-induced ankyrin-domain/NACHT-domain-containing protein [Mycena olivaceomarginata]|nr:ectomycorrhiza-induced ankyrin-domain/NACHT-domain-containing protein [Mycena olivaceomarginata]
MTIWHQCEYWCILNYQNKIIIGYPFRAELRSTTAKLVNEAMRNKLDTWLRPPNPGANHGRARKLRVVDTSVWLVKTTKFAEWKEKGNSFLWVHGISGCGKTILASTIIDNLLDLSWVTAYFYFDTNDTTKQDLGQLLNSLVTQLSALSYEPDKVLDTLYVKESNGKHPPKHEDLVKVLQKLLTAFKEGVYIVLDALDECRDKTDLVAFIRELLNWNLRNLHVVVTSRREGFDSFRELSNEIPLTPADVEEDIKKYVEGKVRLQPWDQDVKELVTSTLLEQGNGMFRLISCQLAVLEQWDSPAEVKQALIKLPTTLAAIYDRILQNLSQSRRNRVHKIMQWLVFAARPVTLAEVVDALAFKFEDSFTFSPGDERVRWDQILDMCGSLVTATTEKGGLTEGSVITLAHASVKEYLMAGESSTAKQCGVNQQAADHLIAHTCLGYLCYFDESHPLKKDNVNQFPLSRYSAQFWPFHINRGREDSSSTQHILDLLQAESMQYITWIRILDVDKPWRGTDWGRNLDDIPQPLYYSALLGLADVSSALLMVQDNVKVKDVSAQGGYYGNALQAASAGGHDAVVRELLAKGADVIAQGGEYGNALQAASARGHDAVVRELLAKGANVSAQGGPYGNALQAASAGGHDAVVRELLAKGADVSAQGGPYDNALQAASAGGHNAVVRELLAKGADVSAQGGEYGNALQTASAGGHDAVVRELLAKGADVSAQGGPYGNALQAASAGGHDAVVRELLAKGADVSAQGGPYGNSLQAASARGHDAVVRELLAKGADVSAQRGRYGNSLQAASAGGHNAVVRELLAKGADVNAQGGPYGNALQAASAGGHNAVVRELLAKGAGVSAQGGLYGNALQAASARGHDAVVRELLAKGADVSAQGGLYGTALQAASARGHDAVVRELLAKGTAGRGELSLDRPPPTAGPATM